MVKKENCGRGSYGYFFILALVFGVISSISFASAIWPDGANATVVRTEATNSTHTSTSLNAYAGNVTELNIQGFSATQTWQGYFGNVTGTIQLTDNAGHQMYNWSAATPTGEVLASSNNTIYWPYIQCFNYTAAGSYASDTAQAGGTSLYGKNISQLEIQYNTNGTTDGIDETFTAVGGKNFYVSNQQFSTTECKRMRVFDNSGASNGNNFEEAILYEPSTTSVIFTALVENNRLGFDTGMHDFEMLVPDDGHGTNTNPTTYYFYVELE